MQVEAGLSVAELLAASKLPAPEARALLAHLLGVARETLIARPEQPVEAVHTERFFSLVAQRRHGEPLAYLLGQREFYGRTFAVSPAVLIPRPETELLIEVALRLVSLSEARVLDLGTGSGCIAITLARERSKWRVDATDLSPEAIDVARSNLTRWRVDNVALHQGHWFGAINNNVRYDLILANPPYVAAGDPHLDALRFEPHSALVAGHNGLGCLQAIIEGAARHLAPGGYLALEHGHDQGPAVRSLLAARRWRDVQTEADRAGLDRVTYALAPPFDAAPPLATLERIQSE